MKSKSILLALISVIGMSVALAALFYKTSAATLSASDSFFPKDTAAVPCSTEAEPTGAFAVPVNDLTALTITCPPDFNLPCPATIYYSSLEVTSDCPGGASVSCNPPSGSSFYQGTTNVTCTASDMCSNTAQCTFTVRITETQIICPANLTVPTPSGCVNVEYATPTVNGNCLPRVTVSCAPPSGTCFALGTTTVNCTATDAVNNISSCAFTVTAIPCPVGCLANITTNIAAGQCGAIVSYPLPTVAGGCGSVTCTPASGSFFVVGTTVVNCALNATPACSFAVTVNDPVPPVINCPLNVAMTIPSGMANAVVNYKLATATDQCGIAEIACLPPSGATFPAGATTVTCRAKDPVGNLATCSFTVTLTAEEPPSIHCPQNVTLQAAADQTSAIVTYLAPTVTGSLSGAAVNCSPPSGATFALGATTVTCTAMDTAGHHASCDFLVNVDGGPPGVQFLLPDGKTAVVFGKPQPVQVKRKSKKAKGPCGLFTIENTSFASVELTLDAIIRAGSDVDSQHISDPREGSLYALNLINADGSETPLAIGDTVTLEVSERRNFCFRVNLALPGLAGSSTNLSAPQVIPDLIETRLIFKLANGNSLVLNINVNVETAVRFINPDNPRLPAKPSFTTSGNEFAVSFAVFDSNLDVNRAKYEFFDAGGAVVAGPFEIDLVQAIRERNLVRGQSFAVTQHFTEASTHPEVVAVRVTIFDGETSVSSPIATLGAAAASVKTQSRRAARLRPVAPPPARMDSPRR
jgi:HYR domain